MRQPSRIDPIRRPTATAMPIPAALGGATAFAVLWGPAGQSTPIAAGIGIAVAVGLRIGSIRLGWRTGALGPGRGSLQG